MNTSGKQDSVVIEECEVTIDCAFLSNNDFFKMGAVVAIGELFDHGKLGNKKDVALEVRDYLSSFGIRSISDMRSLGMGDHYLEDFKGVYPEWA